MSVDVSDKFGCRLILFPSTDDSDDVPMMIVVVLEATVTWVALIFLTALFTRSEMAVNLLFLLP